MRQLSLSALFALSSVSACSSSEGADGDGTFATAGETPSDGSTGITGDDSGDETEGGQSDDDDDGDESGDADDGPKLDVGEGDDGGELEVCDAVDILFVIDSSGSMHDEQIALGEAFPQFTDTIVDTLPDGTSVHIGVTTTEMSPGGNYAVTFPCADPKPEFYQTPDLEPSGVNGAQGRLFKVGNGPAYYEITTDAPAQELQEMSEWFVDAAMVGTEGSSEEMTLAGAGWAFDPINDPTNAGFVRDEGAALVLFFVTDENDQTPIDGVAQGLIDRIAAAKAGCGGLDCVAAGGTVRESCLDQDALGIFLDALDPERVHTQPLEYNVQTDPDLFIDALRDNLAKVIVDLCKQIPPAG